MIDLVSAEATHPLFDFKMNVDDSADPPGRWPHRIESFEVVALSEVSIALRAISIRARARSVYEG